MLTTEQIEAIADDLATADRTRVPLPLLSTRFSGMTVDDSYAVQQVWARRAADQGRRLIGRKIGLTSRAMQAATGIDEPDYGVIFDDMVFENGCEIPFTRFSNVRVEVELAFKLGKDLSGPGCTIFDVLDATDYVVPTLEILDSRIELKGRSIIDTISDNAAMGAMILGGSPVRPHSIDLRWVGAILYRNGTVEETGLAAGVLNHPASGIVWLTNKLAAHEASLSAGELILAGSFTRPVWVDPGDTFLADYGPLGSVTCQFS